MPRVVAFLRAINVGGRVVKMDALKALFTSLGFTHVETFIASGNVIFDTRSSEFGPMEAKIERSLAKAFGYDVATFLRTGKQVEEIARYQPFPTAAMTSAAALNVGLLKAPLSSAALASLTRLKTDVDDFHIHGSELYWICLRKQSESKISNAVFERTLKVKATFRGMRTMKKLAAKYPA